MTTDSGEVSDEGEDQDENIEMNGECKLERQNSKTGSIKRQIMKVSVCFKHFLGNCSDLGLRLA